ncbi:hypothetical protein E2C01_098419 [Portunus trituberculatus]|uniref:Uncharacterized protein n=1 Tax=Portunus trituberculatus TaxID=210409 RepID=A0A5B7K875_PORTR|nr:hypothetical protein [Portunus trituberculatus]
MGTSRPSGLLRFLALALHRGKGFKDLLLCLCVLCVMVVVAAAASRSRLCGRAWRRGLLLTSPGNWFGAGLASGRNRGT